MNESTAPASPSSEVIRIGQLEIRYLQESHDGAQVGCFEMQVPPGANVPPPHSHDASEELLYVLDGTLRCTVGGETRDLSRGDVIGTPRGVVHAFSNPHAVTARVLVMNSPGIDPDYFREVAAIAGAGGAPDRAKMVANMHRFGLRPAAPRALPRGGRARTRGLRSTARVRARR